MTSRALSLLLGAAVGAFLAAGFGSVAPGVHAARNCAADAEVCMMEIQP